MYILYFRSTCRVINHFDIRHSDFHLHIILPKSEDYELQVTI